MSRDPLIIASHPLHGVEPVAEVTQAWDDIAEPRLAARIINGRPESILLFVETLWFVLVCTVKFYRSRLVLAYLVDKCRNDPGPGKLGRKVLDTLRARDQVQK